MWKKLKRPSIRDVAREAGVSISTVSSVVNKTKFVKEDRQKRVLSAVKKLNYKPNIIARGLRTRSTRAVGVIVPDIAQPFFSQVIRGMEEVAREREYTLILSCTFYDVAEEERQMNVLVDQFIDGLLFFCGYDNYSHIKKIYNQNIPVVVIDREVSDPKIPSVLIDNTKAMEQAVDYLCSYGHREIGYVTFTFENQATVRNRYAGYCSGLKKNNISHNPDIAIIDNTIRLNESRGTYNIIKELHEKRKMPTAFTAIADFSAIGLIKALKETGYRVPQDVSVVGFNNEIVCEFSDPPLTTVKQPKKLMGATAMNLLLDIVEGKKVKNKNIILPTSIIERGSVAAPPKNTK